MQLATYTAVYAIQKYRTTEADARPTIPRRWTSGETHNYRLFVEPNFSYATFVDRCQIQCFSALKAIIIEL